ncbi:MAG TPA: DedA family protein [Roseateles sp.]|nr:DedA family protein [Roseateles sp.]HWT55238.1 DedA family protein [Rhodocyclaceae bacterium]
MELLTQFIDIILHLDKHLAVLVANYGLWIYAILFLIIFGETGFVVLPFLPGDSLLFVAGAVAAVGGMDLGLLIVVLLVAAILGNTLNYTIGRIFGERIVAAGRIPFIKPSAIAATQIFYARHGGKAVVISRFMPLFRTFVPFVAGMARMSYARFTAFNVAGAAAWVLSLCVAGYLFGNVPVIKNNLSLLIIGIVVVSLLPALIGWMRHRNNAKSAG